MNNKRLLVVSSSLDEAITQWILANKAYSSSGIDVLLLEELLKACEIQDELTPKKTVIRWFKNGRLRYGNASHHLLNRIIYIDDKLFECYEKGDQEYAKREFEAYLGFSLNSFSKVQNIAINGLCERVYSLPFQWMLVEKQLKLQVPHYYWGLRQSNTLVPQGNCQRVVYSHIYDFLNWSNPVEVKEESTQFCFLRPLGEPVCVLSLGAQHLFSSSITLSDDQRQDIEKIAQDIRRLFSYFVFELVLFVHQEKISFGCVNIDLVRSSKNPEFNYFMDSYFLKEYYQCLNLKHLSLPNTVQK